MATRIETFPLAHFPFPPRILHPSAIVRLLLLLSICLSVASLASAQTSGQQYVYGSASAAANSPTSVVAAFSKTSQTGALTPVPGSPFSDRLEGGLMVIDGQGKFLFVLNPVSDDISMFQIDQTSGVLSEVPASPFAVPPAFSSGSPPSNPLSIAAERSGKFLFVGYLFESGSQGPSSVASLAIDTSGPSPVLVTVESILTNTGGSPRKLLTDSKGLHLYVGLGVSSSGMLVGGAEVYSIDASTGNLSYQGMAGSSLSFGIDYAIDPQDRFFFATGGTADFLQSCIISPVDGTANTCPSFFDLFFSNTGMLVENSGHFLYIGDGDTSGSVAVYSVDQTTGTPTQVGSATGITLAQGRSVADPMGPYIYSADQTTPPVVHAFQVDPQTGNLTEMSGSPFGIGITSVGCCQGLAISGNPVQAISGPAATMFPSSAATFTATAGTISSTQIFSIVNQGNQLLAINSILLAGTDASSFSQSNTCLATLAPNAHCSVSITFNPASVGTFAANLQVADNAPGSPQTLLLNGTGTAPVPTVTFSPTAPAFPASTQGTSSAPQTLTLINSGSGPLHVSGVSLAGPNPSDFSFTNNCTAPVAPASNCTIAIVFSPLAPGQRTANVLVSDDASGSPLAASLSATANPAFAVAAVAGSSTTASVTAGQMAQYQMQLTPGPGYSGTVSLTCSGAPLGAMCHVPASVSLANGTATPFTVTVTTSGPATLPPSTPMRFPPFSQVPLVPLLALALLSLIAFRAFQTAAGRNRFAMSGILAAAIFSATLGIAGCGGGSAAVAPPPPLITPPGTSTITVTMSAMSPSGQPLQLQPLQLTLTVK